MANIISVTDQTLGLINISENIIYLVEEFGSKSRVNVKSASSPSTIQYVVDEDLASIKAQSTLLYDATIGGINVLLNAVSFTVAGSNPSGGSIVVDPFNNNIVVDEDILVLIDNIDKAGGPQFAGTVLGTNAALDAWALVGGDYQGEPTLFYDEQGVGTLVPFIDDPYAGTSTPMQTFTALGVISGCGNPTKIWAFNDANGLTGFDRRSGGDSFSFTCSSGVPFSPAFPVQFPHFAIIDSGVRTQYTFLDSRPNWPWVIIDVNQNPIGGRPVWCLDQNQYLVCYWNAVDNAWDVETNNPSGEPASPLQHTWWRLLNGYPSLV